MKHFISFLLFISSFLFSSSYATGEERFTVNLDTFEHGSYWIWSYSEKTKDSDLFQQPYLYEKYEVVKVQGDKITIEMSSSSDLVFDEPAHHKFRADLSKCLELGESSSDRSMRSWKIAFYTKSLGPDWSLVSKSFKSLAFTEKFNCFSSLKTNTSIPFSNGDEYFTAYQTPQKNIKTWFAKHESKIAGVGVLRLPKSFKMELIQAN